MLLLLSLRKWKHRKVKRVTQRVRRGVELWTELVSYQNPRSCHRDRTQMVKKHGTFPQWTLGGGTLMSSYSSIRDQNCVLWRQISDPYTTVGSGNSGGWNEGNQGTCLAIVGRQDIIITSEVIIFIYVFRKSNLLWQPSHVFIFIFILIPLNSLLGWFNQ